ncbi:MAG: alpha/beta fold hydrolase [Flavobacteriaceae bacterium]|nr:MAG: alpha/beta fold hydrolase [Flavobacteriaceae bacterium]
MATKDLSLHHIIKESSVQKNAPLLIMCHGYGSDENDLFSFASELPKELFIISVRAPYAMMPFGNAWYAINFDGGGKWSDDDEVIGSRDLLKKFVEEACDTYPVDKDNVTLLGFSQGTILSLAVALSYPEIIKNVVALSGYVNKDILPGDLKEKDFSNLDIYVSHGSVDQVIPVEWARKTSPFLNELNISHSYSEFPVGHGVAPQNFFEFKEWLEKRI